MESREGGESSTAPVAPEPLTTASSGGSETLSLPTAGAAISSVEAAAAEGSRQTGEVERASNAAETDDPPSVADESAAAPTPDVEPPTLDRMSSYARAYNSSSPLVRFAFRFTKLLKLAYMFVGWSLAVTICVAITAVHCDSPTTVSLLPVGAIICTVCALNVLYFFLGGVRPLLLHAALLQTADAAVEKRRDAAFARALAYIMAAVASLCFFAYGAMLAQAGTFTRTQMSAPLAIGLFILAMWLVAYLRYGDKTLFETVAAWAGIALALCLFIFVIVCGMKLDAPGVWSAVAVFVPLYVADATLLLVPAITWLIGRVTGNPSESTRLSSLTPLWVVGVLIFTYFEAVAAAYWDGLLSFTVHQARGGAPCRLQLAIHAMAAADRARGGRVGQVVAPLYGLCAAVVVLAVVLSVLAARAGQPIEYEGLDVGGRMEMRVLVEE